SRAILLGAEGSAHNTMSFGISGFGAAQTQAVPQLFQTLSLIGSSPTLPATPYGTAAPLPATVGQTSQTALPLSLLLRASQQHAAILAMNAVPPKPPLTTSYLGATNVLFTATPNVPPPAFSPLGAPANSFGQVPVPVSFVTTAPTAAQTATQDVVAQTFDLIKAPQTTGSNPTQSAQSAPIATPQSHPVASGSSATGTVAPSGPVHVVKAFLSTVRSLAVQAIYSQPLFSVTA
ncbi:MAG: hypothetical protein ACYDA1_06735, partial [Vulcanimicrobiaceae bacterium]